MSWFFLLLIIIKPPQAVSLADNRKPDPLRPSNIASDEKLAYATPGAILLSTE